MCLMTKFSPTVHIDTPSTTSAGFEKCDTSLCSKVPVFVRCS